MSAAIKMNVPLIVHEQNSIPGRSNLIFGRKAFCVLTAFFKTESQFKGCKVLRTGLPIRRELRELAGRGSEKSGLLVAGGSQGAKVLNDTVCDSLALPESNAYHWTHLTGSNDFDSVSSRSRSLELGDNYKPLAYLDGELMGQEFLKAALFIGRSGAGTSSELAAFRLPSILVPYPTAFANHQFHNAKEFESIGAALVVEQKDLTAQNLMSSIERWMSDTDMVQKASSGLALWDVPDSCDQILKYLRLAAKNRNHENAR